jgi:hypothetical protein
LLQSLFHLFVVVLFVAALLLGVALALHAYLFTLGFGRTAQQPGGDKATIRGRGRNDDGNFVA